MAIGTRRADFGLRAETNFYLKRVQKMGKSLITASTQWRNFNLMVVSQWITMPRVVAELQTNTCLKVIRAQQTDSDLIAVLQRTTTLRVVTNRQIYLTL